MHHFTPPLFMSDDFPTSLSTKMRACKNCSQLKSLSSFRAKGCENCPMLSDDYLSSKFKGMIALLQPGVSWVAKWQRINENRQGLYAMTVDGPLCDENVYEVEKTGKTYHDRSASFKLE